MDTTTGTTSLEKFTEVYPRNETHITRLIGIIQRHGNYCQQWADAIKMYGKDTPEFELVISVLSKDITSLLDEAKETLSDLQTDFIDLAEVFNLFQKEIAEVKEKTNVSRPSIFRRPHSK